MTEAIQIQIIFPEIFNSMLIAIEKIEKIIFGTS